MATFTMKTPSCLFCGKVGEIKVPLQEYYEYRGGKSIQRAFVSLTTDEREQILSGTHVGSCSKKWDELFAEIEEDWEEEDGEIES